MIPVLVIQFAAAPRFGFGGAELGTTACEMAVRGSIPWNDRFLGGKEVGNIMVSNIKCCRDVGVIFLRRLYYTTNF